MKPNPLQSLAPIFNRILKLSDALLPLAPLITRLIIGRAFTITGAGKWSDLAKVTGFFTDLGIPFPGLNATFVSGLELFGGALLMAGLFSRGLAFLLSGSMVVALMTADRESFLTNLTGDLTGVTPIPFLLGLIWIVLYGPGKFSLDELIWKRFGIGETKPPSGA